MPLTQQQINSQIAIGAANAIYSANNPSGTQLVVGQPLVYPSDMAGITPGYSALPNAPSGYTVRLVNNDAASGLNLFVAYNVGTNTAIVGIAGINGVLKTAPGSAADTTQIVSGMQDQIATMFRGNTEPNSGILAKLNELAGEGYGQPLNIIIGGQSGAGPSVDALIAALKNGLSVTAKGILDMPDQGSDPDPRTVGIEAFSAANLHVEKINTLGSEYVLDRLGMRQQGEALIADGATVNTIIAGDSARNYRDPVAYYGGRQYGSVVSLDVPYPAGFPTGPGDVLAWYHRVEGALGYYMKQGGQTGDLSSYTYTPLSMESVSAVMNAFSGIKWDSNTAAYGGLGAIGMFASAFSWPGQSAQAIGKTLAATFGSNDYEGFFTALGGVLEAGLKYAAFTNPAAFVTRVGFLLFGSKVVNAMMGADNSSTPTQVQVWLATLPPVEAGGARQVFNDPNFGLTAIDTLNDKTVFRQVDGTVQTVGTDGSYQASFQGGAKLSQTAQGVTTLSLTASSNESIKFTLTDNQVVNYLPPTDAQGNVLPGPGIFRLETSTMPGQPPAEVLIQSNGSWQLGSNTTSNITFSFQRIDKTGLLISSTEVSSTELGLETVVKTPDGQVSSTSLLQVLEDNSRLSTTTYPNGKTEILSADDTGKPYGLLVTIPGTNNSETVVRYSYIDGKPVLQSSKTIDYFYDENGVSRIETVTTATGTVRNAYDTDGQLHSSTPVQQPAVTSISDQQVTSVLNDIAGLVGAIQGGKPLPTLSSGLHLLNTLDNLDSNVGNNIPYLTQTTAVVGGLASLYSLSNALENGDALSKVNATLSTLNYVNSTLPTLLIGAGAAPLNASLNGFLNGTGTGANGAFAGLGAGNVPGVLPVLGLIMSIRSGDAVGIIQGIMGLVNPALLTSPIGWVLIGVQILKAFDEPPESWGSARIVFDANGQIRLDTVGEGSGPDRVLQGTLDVLNSMVAQAQAGSPGNPLGIVPQRMPSITWREARQDDKGYAITDVDPLTGEQRYPYLRWDAAGVPFNRAELVSNPLVVDPAKGDGGIDTLDPVYAQLKVWHDLDRHSSNTQDEHSGERKFRSLIDWSITAIDNGKSRHEFGRVSAANGMGCDPETAKAMLIKVHGHRG